MFKIREFSKLARVSMPALRHYDQVSLLKPAQVDPDTAYRYYTADQLPRLHRILALKDLGFSLAQIADVLDADLPAAEIRGMLKLKRAEMERLVEEEQGRLARIEARLRAIEQDRDVAAYDVVLKPNLATKPRQDLLYTCLPSPLTATAPPAR